MTNFEKMKPALDMIFDDINLDEAAKVLSNGLIACEFCNIRNYCDEKTDIYNDSKPPLGKIVTCEEVCKMWLKENAEKTVGIMSE